MRQPAAALTPLDPVLPPVVPCGELAVRAWADADAPALCDAVAANLEHLRGFMPWIAAEPLAPAQRVDLFSNWEAERRSGGGSVYGILRAGVIVGGCGLHRRGAPDALEIGYWLAAQEQGRGTITAVVHALTDLALAHPMITNVEIHMDAANVRSAAVPPRCGYELVGDYECEVAAPLETGRGLVWRRTRR